LCGQILPNDYLKESGRIHEKPVYTKALKRCVRYYSKFDVFGLDFGLEPEFWVLESIFIKTIWSWLLLTC
jgi:hypothetical protein